MKRTRSERDETTEKKKQSCRPAIYTLGVEVLGQTVGETAKSLEAGGFVVDMEPHVEFDELVHYIQHNMMDEYHEGYSRNVEFLSEYEKAVLVEMLKPQFNGVLS